MRNAVRSLIAASRRRPGSPSRRLPALLHACCVPSSTWLARMACAPVFFAQSPSDHRGAAPRKWSSSTKEHRQMIEDVRLAGRKSGRKFLADSAATFRWQASFSAILYDAGRGQMLPKWGCAQAAKVSWLPSYGRNAQRCSLFRLPQQRCIKFAARRSTDVLSWRTRFRWINSVRSAWDNSLADKASPGNLSMANSLRACGRYR